ncbi:unnamed protein product [Lymnaea stagnalis]|uniref:AIG1-type G domain-containing protein n=1 Tax=Lymnaea stagnalis TaxID=6523 RepID=A0AAV2HMB5_LYMST
MSNPTDIDVLLIGKTGNGKSATGNSILRNKVFKSVPSSTSVTKSVESDVTEFDGRVIKVVDGPGVGDTRLNNEESVRMMTNAMSGAIAENARGYHAFLLVVRYGGRFTAEDQDTIVFLKKLFGENFVKSFCILVMTCGDVFEEDGLEMKKTFKEWCRDQEGVLQDLLRECDYRAMIFDNRTKDEGKKRKQLTELIQMIDNLRSQGHRYTDDHFRRAKNTRDRLVIEAQVPVIREETMNEASLILQKLQAIQSQFEPEHRIENLEKLLIRSDGLLKSITEKDKGTGTLHVLSQTVHSIHNTILDEIKFSKNVKEKNERMKKEEEERMKIFQEEMDKQKAAYEKLIQEGKLDDQRRKEMQLEQERMRQSLDEQRKKDLDARERQLQLQNEELRRMREESDSLRNNFYEVKQQESQSFGFLDFITLIAKPILKLFGF